MNSGETKIVLEDQVTYHSVAINPSYGKPVKITLDSDNNMTIFTLDDAGRPLETMAQIALSEKWTFDGGDAAFKISSQEPSYKLDFYPRTQLYSMARLFSVFSPKYKAAASRYTLWREALIRAGVKVQKHRTLLPIVLGVVIAIVALAIIFASVYLFG